MKNTKTLVLSAMFCAVSFLMVALVRIPSAVDFLSYDFKNVLITIAGFIMGPLPAALITIVVALIEMVTISNTGIIGFIMNCVATCAFACVAAACYKKSRTMRGAVFGLIGGGAAMTVVMLLWNYLVTPLYTGMPRAAVSAMLLPVFLPFNVIKAALNGAITLLLYKPVVTALRKSNLVETHAPSRSGVHWGALLVSFAVIVTCALVILVWNGIL